MMFSHKCCQDEYSLRERLRWTLIVKDENQRIYLNQTSKDTMHLEQVAIYSVCTSDNYTLIMEREVYCTLCKKWIDDEEVDLYDGYESDTDYDAIMKQHRELIEKQVKAANNAVKNGKLAEYVKWSIENNPNVETFPE